MARLPFRIQIAGVELFGVIADDERLLEALPALQEEALKRQSTSTGGSHPHLSAGLREAARSGSSHRQGEAAEHAGHRPGRPSFAPMIDEAVATLGEKLDRCAPRTQQAQLILTHLARTLPPDELPGERTVRDQLEKTGGKNTPSATTAPQSEARDGKRIGASAEKAQRKRSVGRHRRGARGSPVRPRR